MQKKWIYALPLLLLLLLCTAKCRTDSVPARILTFNAFYKNYDSGDIGFYIDWSNTSRDKTIDSIVLSISHGTDDEKPLKYRIMEPSGVTPGTHNHTNIYTIPQYKLPDGKITSLSVSVLKTIFTDGSVWKNEPDSPGIAVKIDGNKGRGTFPVQLNEALAYTPPSSSYMRFQADWTNLSETDRMIEIVYKITAKSPYGTPVPDMFGNDTVYLLDDYTSSEGIRPGSVNDVLEHDTLYRKNEEEISASTYEISVCKAISETGTVWINPDENDRIITIVNSNNGVDIRVKLSDRNEVLPVKAEFIYYSNIPYNASSISIPKSFTGQMKALRICICAAVLTDLPYEETIQKVKEYNDNDEEDIDFAASSYDTFNFTGKHTDKYFSDIYFATFAAGQELGLPFVELFWVRKNPFQS